jgi:hypothetical protein
MLSSVHVIRTKFCMNSPIHFTYPAHLASYINRDKEQLPPTVPRNFDYLPSAYMKTETGSETSNRPTDLRKLTSKENPALTSTDQYCKNIFTYNVLISTLIIQTAFPVSGHGASMVLHAQSGCPQPH